MIPLFARRPSMYLCVSGGVEAFPAAQVRNTVKEPDTLLELNIGLMCNSLAMLQPFVRHHIPRLAYRLFGTSRSGYGGSTRQNNNKSNNRVSKVTISSSNKGMSTMHSGRWTGRGRSENYMLHSVGKSGAPASELTVLDRVEDNNKIQITSEFEVIKTTKRDNAKHDTSSERRIMDDSS